MKAFNFGKVMQSAATTSQKVGRKMSGNAGAAKPVAKCKVCGGPVGSCKCGK